MNDKLCNWDLVKAQMCIGSQMDCIVTEHKPFGIFVEIQNSPFVGLLERVRMIKDGYHPPDDYPPIGCRLRATVLGFRDRNKQIDLAMVPPHTPEEQLSMAEETIETGLRFNDHNQLVFFGLERVNEMIAAGKKVIRLEEGRAIMTKSSESGESVKIRFEGFSVLVVVQSEL